MNLKKIILASTIMLLFINISSGSYNKISENINYSNQRGSDYWNWEPYATLNVKGNPLVVLYYGIRSKGYNGQVKWRLDNLTKKTLYNISINKVVYTLSNNQRIKILPHNFIGYYVYSGKTIYTKPDKLSIPQNSNLKLNNINLEAPEISLSLSKDGKILDWDRLGQVVVEYEN